MSGGRVAFGTGDPEARRGQLVDEVARSRLVAGTVIPEGYGKDVARAREGRSSSWAARAAVVLGVAVFALRRALTR